MELKKERKKCLCWNVNILRAVWEELKSRLLKRIRAKLKLDPTGERIKERGKKKGKAGTKSQSGTLRLSGEVVQG